MCWCFYWTCFNKKLKSITHMQKGTGCSIALMKYPRGKRTMLLEPVSLLWPPSSYCLTLLQQVVVILISYVMHLVLMGFFLIYINEFFCIWLLLLNL